MTTITITDDTTTPPATVVVTISKDEYATRLDLLNAYLKRAGQEYLLLKELRAKQSTAT